LKLLIKFFIILSISFSFSFGVSSKYYQDKFSTTKKLYLGAVISNNKKKEIEYLKKLIKYGDKLEIDTIKYKRELNRLDKSVIITKPVTTTFKLKPKYTIKSVKQYKNAITITFNKKIDKSYLKFSEKRKKPDIYGTIKHTSDNQSHSFMVQNRYQIDKKLSINSGIGYLLSENTDQDSAFKVNKRESTLDLSIEPNYQISKKLLASCSLKYIQNSSNIVVYEYDKQTVTFNLKYLF
jgi:hypothetical protein